MKRGRKPAQVAYRGTGPAMNDLIGGHVDFFCEQAVSVAEQVRSGGIKAFGVSATDKLEALPAVPSARGWWRELSDEHLVRHFRAKGTPKEAIDKLAAALDKALDDPTVIKRLNDLGGSVPKKAERTPASFEKLGEDRDLAMEADSAGCCAAGCGEELGRFS